jgi:catechol 2,3-dioxygenase-like lactoylglutathione lyase family enzyme
MSFRPKYLAHVNVYVRDVERSHKWYADLLGLHTYDYRPGAAAFMSADREESHEIALMQVGLDAPLQASGQVGLNHMAWRVESLDDLKEFYRRLKEKRSRESPITGSRWASTFATPMAMASKCTTSCPGASGRGTSAYSPRTWFSAAFSAAPGTRRSPRASRPDAPRFVDLRAPF